MDISHDSHGSEGEDDHSGGNVLLEKIGAAVLVIVLSAVFGYLPLLLSKKINFTLVETTDEAIIRKHRMCIQNVILAFLLNLGGGVLLANSFCHWLPEVREGLEPYTHSISIELPVAELIMCGGFFFICFLEEILHMFLHSNKPKQHKKKVSPTPDSETELNKYDEATNGTANKNIPQESDEIEQIKEEKAIKQIKSAIRTFFIISALSFHSTIEGLALSLEDESAGVWMNTAATALHKFVISFSIGVELISNKVSMVKYSVSILVFSFAPAVGVAIGIIINQLSEDQAIDDLPIQILQGLATGTVVYVVFFEILPKGKSVGGTGFQHVVSMIFGFALFLPSLYFHTGHDHEDEESSCSCTTPAILTGLS